MSPCNDNSYQNLDEILHKVWKNIEVNGICKYKLKLKCKRLPGPIGFVVQSSSQRVQNRRPPQIFNSVSMPFDDKKFNFTKIHSSEILFHVCRKKANGSSYSYLHLEADINSQTIDNVAVANVSPFAKPHMLLVPKLQACRPQILTHDAVELALEMHMLSQSLNFITVFNSMCGQASVNHLHLHSYYMNFPADEASDLIIQRVRSVERKLSDCCFLCESIPLPAFYFQVFSHRDILQITREIVAIVNHLVKRNIAHNLSIVKGTPAVCADADNDEIQKLDAPVSKVFLWPRLNNCNDKRENRIYAGACELSGHIFVLDDDYDSVTEPDVLQQLQSAALPALEFENLVQEVIEVLKAIDAT